LKQRINNGVKLTIGSDAHEKDYIGRIQKSVLSEIINKYENSDQYFQTEILDRSYK